MSFLFISFPWLPHELLWNINKLKQGLYIYIYIYINGAVYILNLNV